MLTCPACNDALVRMSDAGDPQWTCARCRARALPIGTLARIATQEFGRALRQEIDQGVARAGVKCPSCGRAMRELEVPIRTGAATIDLCTSCRLVWLDEGEFDQLPIKQRYEANAVDPAAIKTSLARAEVELAMARNRQRPRTSLDDMTWPQRILSMLGMPVDVDAPEGERPWCTWILGALLVGTFLVELADQRGTFRHALAWIPAQPFRLGGLTILTSFFLHMGWLHLLGNLYFLIAFGSGVERRLGAGRLVVLLAAAAIFGALAHALFDPRSEVPYVGASGGLSALIVYYTATYPWNRFAVTIWLILPRTFSIPAFTWATIWFLWQLFGGFLQLNDRSNVSALAHLGGALTGLAAFLLWRKRASLADT